MMLEAIKYKLSFGASVQSVEEKFTKIWVSGFGSDAKFEDQSSGWYICLVGSHEALFAGFDKPPVKVGEYARVTIEFGHA
jgi:hypothetical protein